MKNIVIIMSLVVVIFFSVEIYRVNKRYEISREASAAVEVRTQKEAARQELLKRAAVASGAVAGKKYAESLVSERDSAALFIEDTIWIDDENSSLRIVKGTEGTTVVLMIHSKKGLLYYDGEYSNASCVVAHIIDTYKEEIPNMCNLIVFGCHPNARSNMAKHYEGVEIYNAFNDVKGRMYSDNYTVEGGLFLSSY